MSSSAQERALREVKEIIRDLPTTGPYSASNLGRLKYIDRIVQDNDSASTYENVSINQALEDLALLALPADTAGALRAGKGGNDLALELVRRNLTEFDALAGVVYDSTEDERGADDGLRRLHGAFSLITELHSALVSAGIDVGRKDWATALTKKMPNLRRLRSAPWFEVALILKLVTEGSESGAGVVQSVPVRDPRAAVYTLRRK